MTAGFFKNTLTVENRGGRVGSGIWDSYLPLIYFKRPLPNSYGIVLITRLLVGKFF